MFRRNRQVPIHPREFSRAAHRAPRGEATGPTVREFENSTDARHAITGCRDSGEKIAHGRACEVVQERRLSRR